jgi:hypothetical protein
MNGMFPIAQINGHHLMRYSLVGANATDPVLPERPKRRRRRRREAAQSRTACAPLALKPRGIS